MADLLSHRYEIPLEILQLLSRTGPLKKKKMRIITLTTLKFLHFNLLAVNPTHLAYGTTFLSQWEVTNNMIVVVMQMHPTNIQTKASNHSGWRSGVKQTWGRLYNVIQVHIKPSRVSPGEKNFFLLWSLTCKQITFKLSSPKKSYLQRPWRSNRALLSL